MTFLPKALRERLIWNEHTRMYTKKNSGIIWTIHFCAENLCLLFVSRNMRISVTSFLSILLSNKFTMHTILIFVKSL